MRTQTTLVVLLGIVVLMLVFSLLSILDGIERGTWGAVALHSLVIGLNSLHAENISRLIRGAEPISI